MRIKLLEPKNFRTFGHVVLEGLPDLLAFVSPNGRGKSSILEAIAGAHDLIVPYHQDNYGFHEQWQQRHVPVWPAHLALPVKLGERRAEINIEIEATGQEIRYLAAAQIQQTVGRARFVIEDGTRITSLHADEAIKRLFQYHNPSEGIGFIDYIRPVRFYLHQQLGNFAAEMRDDRTRQLFMEFQQPCNQNNKFSSLKSFVVSTQLDDFAHEQVTGEKRDTLALFRDVFDHFFAPKRFVGYRSSAASGTPQVVVESPFGSHDTDHLSDGEKEILHIFAHFYRFRHLSNVVLWDTPELHLNAALESRLCHALQRIAPNNQTWIATHSLELINSVPISNIFVIQQDGNTARIERASGEERRSRVKIYQELGAQVGLQLVSAVVVFLEGKEAQSDKRLLDRLVAPRVPGANFVAGGSCENILAVGTRANALLQAACTNGDFLALVDRDYRTDSELGDTVKKYRGRVFVWNCHEVENLFLDPQIVFETLKFLDRTDGCKSPDDVREALKAAACSLREWIAADWVAWEFDRRFQPPSRHIGGQDPAGSLAKYTAKLQETVTEATDPAKVSQQFQAKLVEVDRLIAANQWPMRLPGKQILAKFLGQYPGLAPEDFVRAAASVVLERKMSVPELDRLVQTIREAPTGLGSR
jgi:predicted ATPase